MTANAPKPSIGEDIMSFDATTSERELISRLRHQNQALLQEIENLRTYRTMAYRDPLTGLRNRRYLDERMSEEIDRARRHDDFVFSVLLVDLDEFKEINDQLGHAAGDEVLCWVAEFLEENVRDHDIVCRTGGDEFVVLLPDADELGCALLVERINERLVLANAKRERPVSMSIGQATWPTDGASAERLLGLADARMYEEKQRRSGTSRAARVRPKTLPWSGPSSLMT